MRHSFFFMLTLFFMSSFMASNKNEFYISKGEQLVNSILGQTAKITKDKHNLKPCGAGAAMPGGPIQQLTLCFNTKYLYTKERLRELLIISAQELLKQINENNEIQVFLKERPFTVKNVQIIIYNSEKDGSEVYDPGISSAEVSQGILTYRTVDSTNTFKFKQKFTETYEEALKLLQE